MARFTKDVVAALPLPESGARVVLDEPRNAIKGFGVRLTAGGARTWVLRYTVKGMAKDRTLVLGSFPLLKVEEARKKAAAARQMVEDGGDPVAEAQGALAVRREHAASPSFADAVALFREKRFPKLRLSTQRAYDRVLRGDILPAIGKMKLADIRRRDVQAVFDEVSERSLPSANKALACLSSVMTLAAEKGMLDADLVDKKVLHVAKGIRRHSLSGRERYLTPDELERLKTALAEAQERNPDAADIVWLMLLTGSRKSEVLGMEWSDLRLDEGLWIKPAARVKQGKRHELTLSGPVLDILRRRRAALPPTAVHVFPAATSKTGHRVDVDKFWQPIRDRAGLKDFRPHDLRHSAASLLISNGASLAVVGSVLGHSTPATTARYAHLMRDAQKEATAMLGDLVTGTTSPQPPTDPKVVDLAEHRKGHAK